LHTAGGTYEDVAVVHDIPLSSLWHHDHGRQSRRDGHENQKKVLNGEEELVKLLRELDSWGLHFDCEFIMARAQDILNEHGSDDIIIQSWYRKFRARFPDLKTQLSERKNVAHSDAEKDLAQFDKAFKNVRVLFCVKSAFYLCVV
jgi:hypothetical protein